MAETILKVDPFVLFRDAERLRVAEAGFQLQEVSCPTEEDILRHGADAAAILTVAEPFTSQVIAGLNRCRIISRFGIGLDNIDVDAATEAGIFVSHVPDFCIDEVSDHALAMLLSLSRQLPALDRSLRDGSFDNLAAAGMIRRLRGQRLGLIGFGRIARRLAVKASAIGLEVVAHDHYVTDQVLRDAGVLPVSLADLLASSNIVSIHVPLTSETRGLIDRNALKSMMPTAFLLNVSRGPIVEEAALIEALEGGWIGGAGLDVFETEPPRGDNELLGFSNVIVSNHAAYYSEEALAEVRDKALEDALRVLAGELPVRAVNAQEVVARRGDGCLHA